MRLLLCALLLLVACGVRAATRLVLIGTGTPNFSSLYAPSCSVVLVDGTPYMVDAGDGSIRRMFVAGQLSGLLESEGLDPLSLKTLFLTHLHSDHTMGVEGAVLLPWALGRDFNLTVLGPEGTEELVDLVVESAAEDIAIRSLTFTNGGYGADGHDVSPGVVYQDERVTVTAFEVHHGAFPQAFGFRFDTVDGVSIVFSGDTTPVEAVVDACDGCDVLVHEVYSESLVPALPEWQKQYYEGYHTSSTELGAVASRAQPGLLVLNHHILHGVLPERLVEEVEGHYDGEVAFGHDFDVFEVSATGSLLVPAPLAPPLPVLDASLAPAMESGPSGPALLVALTALLAGVAVVAVVKRVQRPSRSSRPLPLSPVPRSRPFPSRSFPSILGDPLGN